MRLNDNYDGYITARVNALGSTIETLQDNVSWISNGHTENVGRNNNSASNNNDGNNAKNGHVNVNNRSNSSNFDGSMRRRGVFSYMTTARMETTKVHDMNHVPKPTKPDTRARTESDSHSDNTFAGKNMILLSYTGYQCNVNSFPSDLKSM